MTVVLGHYETVVRYVPRILHRSVHILILQLMNQATLMLTMVLGDLLTVWREAVQSL